MGRCPAVWSEANAGEALLLLALDDQRGNPARQAHLPANIYATGIAPFLQFGDPLPNQLYVFGGRNQDDGPMDFVEMFDSWHGCWVPCPSMTVKRAGCGAALLPDRRIIVVGGYDDAGIVKGLLASCEIFDPAQQIWETAVGDLLQARWGHGCVCLAGQIYVVGGCSLRPGAPPRETFMETLRSCEVYNPQTNTWRRLAELHTARAGSRVVPINDRWLAAVGGCDDVFGRAEMLPTVEILDTTTGKWSMLDTLLSTPRTTAAVAALSDDYVMIVGGAPSLSSGEVYPVSAMLGEGASPRAQPPPEVLPAIPEIPEGRMGCQAVAMQLPAPGREYPLCDRNCIVILGGENGEEDFDGEQEIPIRQFDSVLVYDVQDQTWRPESFFPPMLVARTAMAMCVGYGLIRPDVAGQRSHGSVGGS